VFREYLKELLKVDNSIVETKRVGDMTLVGSVSFSEMGIGSLGHLNLTKLKTARLYPNISDGKLIF